MSKKSNILMNDLTQEFLSGNTTDVVDIITFVEAPWGLNFSLFPAQRVILKAFYGLPLTEGGKKNIIVPDETNEHVLYNFTESEFHKFLVDEGRCNTDQVTGKDFTELILVLGRRSGKSSLASCISCYELYKLVKRGDPAKYYGHTPDSQISITNVAPTDAQAGVVFEMIQAKALSCPFLRDRSVNQTLTYFNLQTDADLAQPSRKKKASLTSLAGGCASNSLRGRNNIIIVMDEMAFFIDNSGKFSGGEVYKALKPSTASFKGDGKIISISSPYAKYGQFWDLYQQSFQDTDSMLMFQMYSTMCNPTIDSRLLKSEKKRDPLGFLTEYASEFSDKVTAWIDDEDQFRSCIDLDRKSSLRGQTGIDYFMGIDLGLKNDGTGICICHKESANGKHDGPEKIIVDYAVVYFSGSSDIWEMERTIYKDCTKYSGYEIIPVTAIADEIAELCKWFSIRVGWFDQYNGYALLEQLQNRGLKQFRMEHVTEGLNNNMFQVWKSLYGDNLVEFPNDDLLINEMMQLEAERKNKAKIIVRAPNKKGGHDDISDATARAIFEAYNNSRAAGKKTTASAGSGSTLRGSMNTHIRQRVKNHGTNPRSITDKRLRARYC